MINVDYFSTKWNALPDFSDFISGKQNAFNTEIVENAIKAKARNESIAELNPILIKAPTSSGKTLLLEALAKKAHELNPDLNIALGQALGLVKFFTDKKSSLKRIREVQEADIVLLDDIHFLSKHTDVHRDFTSLFDTLLRNEKLLIVTFSSRARESLMPSVHTALNFEEALLSRLCSGIILNFYPPDLDVRMRFAEKSAKELKLNLTKSMYLILARFCQDLRQLNGLVKTLAAYAKTSKKIFNEEDLEIMLKGYTDEYFFTPELIIQQTASFYGLTMQDIRGKSRVAKIVLARQVSMYLCRKLLGFSYAHIAEIFGSSDHTKAMYACKKIENEQSLTPLINTLTQKITQNASPLTGF